jgi:MFS transporter, Spinster family, sphingosine-1-phosphate transporter
MAPTVVNERTGSTLDTNGPQDGASRPVRGAYLALGLLLAMNLFNYIDRQVLAAVEPEIRLAMFGSQDEDSSEVLFKSGLLSSAFLVSYMLTAPLFGALERSISRWRLIAIGVFVWSLATGAGGLAGTFIVLLLTRCFVGVGEGAYGPLAPSILSDSFPVSMRGKILSYFYVAMPVGGALGYALGGSVVKWVPVHESWRWAFFIVVIPGIILTIISLWMRESPKAADPAEKPKKLTLRDCRILAKTPSFVLNTLGMTAMAFGMGALAFWMPAYLKKQPDAELFGIEPRTVFGAITALAGLGGTLLGGALGDWLRRRLPGSYFIVSGWGLIVSGVCVVLFLHLPFPYAWWMIFAAVFFMFINTGPTNAILANVVHPVMRPAGFALNILIIHALGDVISPPIIGAISGRWGKPAGFEVVAVFLALGGLLWLWGGRYLGHDTEIAATRL